MIGLEQVLVRVARGLNQLGVEFALIGGLAVAYRAEPRPTRDIDLTVAVSSDAEAENLVRTLFGQGYRPYPEAGQIEQTNTGRLATVRLVPPTQEPTTIVVDLLFASSGIEPEIVAAAEFLRIVPGYPMPVATIGHLIALKVLSASPRRAVDTNDIVALLREASEEDLATARHALDLITRRGYNRDKDLAADLEVILRG